MSDLQAHPLPQALGATWLTRVSESIVFKYHVLNTMFLYSKNIVLFCKQCILFCFVSKGVSYYVALVVPELIL